MSEMSLFEKRHVNLNKLRNFLSNTASADLIRKFEAELVIGFFDCVEVDAQSPPVAQVEVYRKALEALKLAEYEFNCIQANLTCDDPKDGIGWALKRAKEAAGWMREAILTAKPEPVAPVRKWEAENVVGGQGPYVRGLRGEDSRVYFQDLSPEVQALLRGQAEKDMTPEEALAEARKRARKNESQVIFDSSYESGTEFRVEWGEKLKDDYRLHHGMGNSFREAFASADKAEAEREKK